MAKKIKNTVDEGYTRLKEDFRNGSFGKCYIFHGEEDYLRSYYTEQISKRLVDESFREFNCAVLEGAKLDLRELESAIDSVPMMSERKVVIVKDFDLYAGGDEQRSKVAKMIEELPEYICLLLVYETMEYRQDNRMKNPTGAIKEHVCVVEFKRQAGSEMLSWVRRRFKSNGHDIDTRTTEYLMFLCGGLMTNLVSEINKISAYAKQEIITRQDIDAVAVPVLDAVAFDLTDNLASGDFDKAMKTLGELLLMKEEPIEILGAVGNQVRSMHLTRLAKDNGAGLSELTAMLGYSSDYPTRRLISAVEKRSAAWCAKCVRLCCEADVAMKSFSGDRGAILQTLLIKMRENGEPR